MWALLLAAACTIRGFLVLKAGDCPAELLETRYHQGSMSMIVVRDPSRVFPPACWIAISRLLTNIAPRLYHDSLLIEIQSPIEDPIPPYFCTILSHTSALHLHYTAATLAPNTFTPACHRLRSLSLYSSAPTRLTIQKDAIQVSTLFKLVVALNNAASQLVLDSKAMSLGPSLTLVEFTSRALQMSDASLAFASHPTMTLKVNECRLDTGMVLHGSVELLILKCRPEWDTGPLQHLGVLADKATKIIAKHTNAAIAIAADHRALSATLVLRHRHNVRNQCNSVACIATLHNQILSGKLDIRVTHELSLRYSSRQLTECTLRDFHRIVSAPRVAFL